ncbi:hypothetical protein [Burkholderia anthina]|uniref:hypothetical protein n=1 Tax=Burkholderia anthina TaxID=179879 RepID=UPI00158926AC|nr:hypothetical protein [Burkholderia anthina]
MAIVLKRLVVRGEGKADAELTFESPVQILRGPSETGKSYVFSCLWYMLGGLDAPKEIPPYGVGYDSVFLEFESGDGGRYTVARGLTGGGANIYRCAIDDWDSRSEQLLDVDLGALIVELSGALGFQTMRSQSEKARMTADDFRYWSLWPEIQLISEDPLAGPKRDIQRTKRASAFAVLLTGKDDSAIVPTRGKDELYMARGGAEALEEALGRAKASIAPEMNKSEVNDALVRVDSALRRISEQQGLRAKRLREIRQSISVHASELRSVESRLSYSSETLARFKLLDSKYTSDLERLSSLDEGVSLFDALENIPCPLCGVSGSSELHVAELSRIGPEQQRQAVKAEMRKIEQLAIGLHAAIVTEEERRAGFAQRAESARGMLRATEEMEKTALVDARDDFAEDPTELALRRSELTNVLRLFDEIDTLEAEITRLSGLSKATRSPILRDLSADGNEVAENVLGIVNAWGLGEIVSAEFDAAGYDFKFNGRKRTSYGKGVRGILTTAVVIALMEYSLKEGHPHLGTVVVDSPLKAYADPESNEIRDVPLQTVRERMYGWLSKWAGFGQIFVIENEKVPDNLRGKLPIHEFSGKAPSARRGFYPAE